MVWLDCLDAQQIELGSRCCSVKKLVYQADVLSLKFESGEWRYLPVRSSQIGQRLLQMLHLYLRPGQKDRTDQPPDITRHPFAVNVSPVEFSHASLVLSLSPLQEQFQILILPLQLLDGFHRRSLGELNLQRLDLRAQLHDTVQRHPETKEESAEKPKRYIPCRSPDLCPIASSSTPPPTARLPPSRHPSRPSQAAKTAFHWYGSAQCERVASLSVVDGNR